jgi:hypothetical protein
MSFEVGSDKEGGVGLARRTHFRGKSDSPWEFMLASMSLEIGSDKEGGAGPARCNHFRGTSGSPWEFM